MQSHLWRRVFRRFVWLDYSQIIINFGTHSYSPIFRTMYLRKVSHITLSSTKYFFILWTVPGLRPRASSISIFPSWNKMEENHVLVKSSVQYVNTSNKKHLKDLRISSWVQCLLKTATNRKTMLQMATHVTRVVKIKLGSQFWTKQVIWEGTNRLKR